MGSTNILEVEAPALRALLASPNLQQHCPHGLVVVLTAVSAFIAATGNIMAHYRLASATGVSFFYGALDCDTAPAEVRPSLAEEVAVGSFQVRKNLHVLDFSQIPEPTSPFREDYAFLFEEFTRPFLEAFAEDISRPIRADDAVIDYVPPQVFTECIRFWSVHGNQPPDGIIFNSSMRSGGKCVALFRGPEISSEADCQTSGVWLRYRFC